MDIHKQILEYLYIQMDHIIKEIYTMGNLMGKENLLIYKIHIHILGNGKMGYLKDMEHKLLEIICMKGSFVKGKKMGEANFRMVMVAIIRDSFVIILFKEMVNILQRIIFGKEIGKMDI